ncbi:MAG: ABC transporter substrate-binding protein [Kiloniellales bacterium]
MVGGLAFGVALAPGVCGAAPVETPSLIAEVEAGRLPPVAERLPEQPLPTAMPEPGRPGGTLTVLNRGGRDARTLTLLGYARLMGYDARLRLKPDILAEVAVKDGRVFTLKLRRGHKWSDGHPFTAEDFRYYWEDVANHPALSPAGPPAVLLVSGAPPRFEVVDETTVRYTWPRPNREFLPALAAPNPPFIYRPAHYLRRFHARYADPEELAKAVAGARVKGWAQLHASRDRMYGMDNPELPTLAPWVVINAPPTDRFVARRNPYYHRVDKNGRQLPYIDRVVLARTEGGLIAAKAAAGEADLQAIGLSQRDVAVLKKGAERHGFQVHLWRIGRGAQLALYPNLNARDPAWRRLTRDVRFRRALSLAIDRGLINRVVYQGVALTGNNSVLPESPLYRPAYRQAWARFDPAAANALLDAIGLKERNPAGLRLMPDGRPMQLVVAAGETDPAESDVLEIVADGWRQVGIELLPRVSTRQIFRRRIETGATVMSVFYGIANGVPDADTSPLEWVPSSLKQPQWPAWGAFVASGGRRGTAPDLEPARRLMGLYQAWQAAEDREGRRRAWREILEIHADQVFSIGLITGVLQPVVVNARLRNVPAQAIFGWTPGAYFGAFRPDTFWFAE